MVRGLGRRLDRLGIRSPDKTPHALRHTHATAMWEGGMRELASYQEGVEQHCTHHAHVLLTDGTSLRLSEATAAAR